MFYHPNDFHHTATQIEHDTKTASVRGANPSVANAAKNVCTHDAVRSVHKSIPRPPSRQRKTHFGKCTVTLHL